MAKTTMFFGLDVHKDTIVVALAGLDSRGEVRGYETIPTTPVAVKALAAKLGSRHGELRFCYEACPCGYGIHRQLTGLGHDCVVVAPSLIPRKLGERLSVMEARDRIASEP